MVHTLKKILSQSNIIGIARIFAVGEGGALLGTVRTKSGEKRTAGTHLCHFSTSSISKSVLREYATVA